VKILNCDGRRKRAGSGKKTPSQVHREGGG